MNLYSAKTDTTFNAAVDAIFTASDRTELGVILGKINALVTDLEANHKGPLNLP